MDVPTETCRIALACVGCLILGTTATIAQDKGQAGLAMGYPAAVGIVYHITDRVALRPEISASGASSTSSSIVGGNSDGWVVGIGLSGLFYVGKWDKLRSYVSPRFTYSWSRNTLESVAFTPIGGTIGQTTLLESTTNTYSIVGSFGAQYSLSRKFSIFAETGVNYAHSTLESSSATTKADSWGSRTGAGVIFYF